MSIKISKLQYTNFRAICSESSEFLVGTDEEIKERLEEALEIQGYWSGMMYKYYLDGDNWRKEPRVFGS